MVEDEIIEKDINEGGELTLPPVVPTLSAAQQKIEDIGVPIRTVDDVFNESGKIKEDAAKYDIEPLSEPTRLDNKNGKKRNESSKYMIKKLQPDLERLRDLRNYVERDKKKKSYNASSLDARRRNQTISQIENLIKKPNKIKTDVYRGGINLENAKLVYEVYKMSPYSGKYELLEERTDIDSLIKKLG